MTSQQSALRLQLAGILALVTTGVIHLYLTRAAYGAVPYIGLLFAASFAGAVAAAFGIYRRKGWGWLLGFLVSAGTLVGYVLSRTVGLPGLPPMPGAWLDPFGVASLVCEAAFVLLFFVSRPARPVPSLVAEGIGRRAADE